MDLASGLILGIVYVAAPGPIGVETLRQGMKGGLSASLAVQAGSAIGLILYALLALLGAGWVLPEAWQLSVGGCGVIVLFYLGGTTIRDGRQLLLPDDARLPGESSARQAFGTGAFLSLANPLEMFFGCRLAVVFRAIPDWMARLFWGRFFWAAWLPLWLSSSWPASGVLASTPERCRFLPGCAAWL